MNSLGPHSRGWWGRRWVLGLGSGLLSWVGWASCGLGRMVSHYQGMRCVLWRGLCGVNGEICCVWSRVNSSLSASGSKPLCRLWGSTSAMYCYVFPFPSNLDISLYCPSLSLHSFAARHRCKHCILLLSNSQMKILHYHKSAALLISQLDLKEK